MINNCEQLLKVKSLAVLHQNLFQEVLLTFEGHRDAESGRARRGLHFPRHETDVT